MFAGISINKHSILDKINADVLGPVKRGDLSNMRGERVIVLIDGEFGQNLSVSPKEILSAMDSGSYVIGASSMGALRAAELDGFGMKGVGWVYNRFASAMERREDEVALTFNPASGKALTIPMVDILYWIELLLGNCAISKSEARGIEKAGRAIFFADRTKDRYLAKLADVLSVNRVGEILSVTKQEIPDIKRIDANAAISAAMELGSKISKSGAIDVRSRLN